MSEAAIIQEVFHLERSSPQGATIHTFQYSFNLKDIGYSAIEVNRAKQTIRWNEFWPFGVPDHTDARNRRKYVQNKEIMRMGIGTLAHTTALLDIVSSQDITSSFSVAPENTKHPLRRPFLLRMGIDCSLHTPIAEYIERTVTYAKSKGFQF